MPCSFSQYLSHSSSVFWHPACSAFMAVMANSGDIWAWGLDTEDWQSQQRGGLGAPQDNASRCRLWLSLCFPQCLWRLSSKMVITGACGTVFNLPGNITSIPLFSSLLQPLSFIFPSFLSPCLFFHYPVLFFFSLSFYFATFLYSLPFYYTAF